MEKRIFCCEIDRNFMLQKMQFCQTIMNKIAAYALAIASFTTALLSTTFTPRAIACSCFLDKPFAEVAREADLVVLGRVVNHGYPGVYTNDMNLQVLEVLSGSEERSVIRIWGDNGMQCRPYTSRFEDGMIYVMALNETVYMDGLIFEEDQVARALEQPPDYEISVCGAYWLEVQGNTAIGDVFDNDSDRGLEEEPGEPDRVSLDRIRQFFE